MITLIADGGVFGGNPGTGIYFSVAQRFEEGEIKWHIEREERHDMRTNNQAEFMALIRALEWIQAEPDYFNEPTRILMDSQLIVKTVNRIWKCKAYGLVELWQQACHMMIDLQDPRPVHLRWTPRKNVVAALGH